MIPLPVVWGALKAVPWRWVAWGALALVVALAAWRVYGWRQGYLARDEADARIEAVRRDAANQLARLEANYQAAQVASQGYLNELEEVRARPALPTVIVRRAAGCRDVSRPGPARRTDASPASAGSLPGEDAEARDIGPDLEALARDADEVSARLRALQQWNAALAAPC